jgi:hypothetical protein
MVRRTKVPKQSRFGAPLECDLCGIRRIRGNCRPFTLLANVRKEDGGHITRSFGSLDVCKQCWEAKAAYRRQEGNTHDPF